MGCRRIALRIPGIPLLLALALSGCGGVASFDTPFTMYTSIVSADLNGDGRVDIAMSSSYLSGPPPHPGHAVVLLQNPAPADGFSPSVRYDTGNDPDFLLVGDIDGDGRSDIAVTTNAGVYTLIQNGSSPGLFLPAVGYTAGSQPTSIAVGGLNGDGRPDLAVANYGSPDGFIKASASILLQDPTDPGKFRSATDYSTGFRSSSIAIGDLDGDGMMDLAVANPVYSGSKGSISILLQDTGNAGAFLPAANYPGISRPLSVAIADLNGDGNADIAVADDGALVYYQDPVRNGIFSSPIRIGP